MSFVRNHPVISFFVLAYALTWATLPFGTFFAPGALLAALIVAFLNDGLAGLRAIGVRMIRWRVRWIWYVAAIAVPLLVHFVTIGINQATGRTIARVRAVRAVVRPRSRHRHEHGRPVWWPVQ